MTYKFDEFDDEPVALGGVEKLEELRDSDEEQLRVQSTYLVDASYC